MTPTDFLDSINFQPFLQTTERDEAYEEKIRDIYGESCVDYYLNEGYICDEDKINKYLAKLDEILSQKPSKEDFTKQIEALNSVTPRVLL